MRSRAACGLTAVWHMALVLGAIGGAVAQGTPGWALGEQPNFEGTIPNWSDGDALTPGTGGIYAIAEIGAAYEEVEVGFGSVDASGHFTFGLQSGAAYAGGGRPVVDAFCEGLDLDVSVSDPAQRVVIVGPLEVPELLVAGQHARPPGGLIIRRSPPTSRSLIEQYGFVYATTDGTVRGTCSGEGLNVSFDLDLRRGWNSLYMGAGLHIVTAAIPPDAAWYLVNAVTLNR